MYIFYNMHFQLLSNRLSLTSRSLQNPPIPDEVDLPFVLHQIATNISNIDSISFPLFVRPLCQRHQVDSVIGRGIARRILFEFHIGPLPPVQERGDRITESL